MCVRDVSLMFHVLRSFLLLSPQSKGQVPPAVFTDCLRDRNTLSTLPACRGFLRPTETPLHEACSLLRQNSYIYTLLCLPHQAMCPWPPFVFPKGPQAGFLCIPTSCLQKLSLYRCELGNVPWLVATVCVRVRVCMHVHTHVCVRKNVGVLWVEAAVGGTPSVSLGVWCQ